MQNSMVMLAFFCFRPEIPFLDKFAPKQQNCQFKLNLVTRLIQICRIQWQCSPCLFYTGNTLFSQILSKKIEIVSLSLNSAQSIIIIWKIRWSFFFYLRVEIALFRQIWSKNQNFQFKLKFHYND